ncbi:helix-turn-helix domain-containing protein [Paraburkholderia sp. RL17-373-BIF-A]|uniref:helix-turn-helix domain-containing protein n=1 Tax=Paraburkholderia sp. RL17-373-BIF-A TaxID=3031629 RepID=UPI0038BB11FB
MKIQQSASLFGRRLRVARRQAEIPQDRLGVQIGLDEHTASARISRYETGVHEPPFEIAMKLAKALGVPTAYFYCEDEDLAELVLAWVRLSKSERKLLKKLLDTKLLAAALDRV